MKDENALAIAFNPHTSSFIPHPSSFLLLPILPSHTSLALCIALLLPVCLVYQACLPDILMFAPAFYERMKDEG